MKRLLLLTVVAALLLFSVSCASQVIELENENGGYYLEISRCIYDSEFDSVSITNYHPANLFSLPDYQELVQYGYVGIENEGVVYFVYIVDTSIDPESPKAYYTAEFDGETKELLCEEGEYFTDETLQNEAVSRLVNMIDGLKEKYLE